MHNHKKNRAMKNVTNDMTDHENFTQNHIYVESSEIFHQNNRWYDRLCIFQANRTLNTRIGQSPTKITVEPKIRSPCRMPTKIENPDLDPTRIPNPGPT